MLRRGAYVSSMSAHGAEANASVPSCCRNPQLGPFLICNRDAQYNAWFLLRIKRYICWHISNACSRSGESDSPFLVFECESRLRANLARGEIHESAWPGCIGEFLSLASTNATDILPTTKSAAAEPVNCF